MDITIGSKRGRRSRRNKRHDDDPSRKYERYDGAIADGVCVYCGHSLEEHGSMAAMVKKPGDKRRVRIGLSALWCNTCKEQKDTYQVVCYQIPRQAIVNSAGAGFIYSGYQDALPLAKTEA